MKNDDVSNYDDFQQKFIFVLDKHAPMKTKFVRANNQPHVSKALRQAIMRHSRLKRAANKVIR